MKRPTWATVVGILGIIFGCLGILGGGQEIMMPKMIEMQKEMFAAFEKDRDQDQNESGNESTSDQKEHPSSPSMFPPEMLESMEAMWEFPDWFERWLVVSGIFRALVSAFLLFASIWLLQLKPCSIRLFYWASGLTIFFSVVRSVLAISSMSFIGISMAFGSGFGALIDVVLIVVVATGSKEAFRSQDDLPLPQA